jgi:hypothetical protein
MILMAWNKKCNENKKKPTKKLIMKKNIKKNDQNPIGLTCQIYDPVVILEKPRQKQVE